jgi:hypothetical protein
MSNINVTALSIDVAPGLTAEPLRFLKLGAGGSVCVGLCLAPFQRRLEVRFVSGCRQDQVSLTGQLKTNLQISLGRLAIFRRLSEIALETGASALNAFSKVCAAFPATPPVAFDADRTPRAVPSGTSTRIWVPFSNSNSIRLFIVPPGSDVASRWRRPAHAINTGWRRPSGIGASAPARMAAV